MRIAVSTCLLVLSFVFWGHGLYIYSKAWLAQILIEDAWRLSLRSGENVKPWRWADTWPVARIESSHLKKDLFVLAGAHGTSLAFGPGHMDGTDLPGQGASVIGGHRDTHFRFLEHVQLGDEIRVQSRAGNWRAYRIVETRIDDSDSENLMFDKSVPQLMLVTCYPFEAVTRGALRYVVTAEPKTEAPLIF